MRLKQEHTTKIKIKKKDILVYIHDSIRILKSLLVNLCFSFSLSSQTVWRPTSISLHITAQSKGTTKNCHAARLFPYKSFTACRKYAINGMLVSECMTKRERKREMLINSQRDNVSFIYFFE
jgi:hypothetical protein